MVSLKSAEEAMVRRGKIAQEFISLQRPELVDLFLTYQNEAIAARKFLQDSLIELNPEAEILEVGGGILALAIQLASEGFKVTTVEPVGEGFSGISFIMSVYIEISKKENSTFNLIKSPIEDCTFAHKFDFVFSINVMEHLKDPYAVLNQVSNKLKPAGKYRFFCPNYDFPYEPHFGKWLFHRSDGSFKLSLKRAQSAKLTESDAIGLYDSLNFITSSKISKCAKANGLSAKFNKMAFFQILERSLTDRGLKERHRSLAKIIVFLSKLRFLSCFKYISFKIQPVMDVTITLES